MGLGGIVGKNDDRSNDSGHLYQFNTLSSPHFSPHFKTSGKKKSTKSKRSTSRRKPQPKEISSTKSYVPKTLGALNRLLTSTKDEQLKCRLLTPILNNLYEGELVYHDKITMLIKAEIKLSASGIKGIAYKQIMLNGEGKSTIYNQFPESWAFEAFWSSIRFTKESIYSIYSGWRIWPDPGLVKKIKCLIQSNENREALWLTSFSLNHKN